MNNQRLVSGNTEPDHIFSFLIWGRRKNRPQIKKVCLATRDYRQLITLIKHTTGIIIRSVYNLQYYRGVRHKELRLNLR